MSFFEGFTKRAHYISATFKRLGGSKLERTHMASQLRKGRAFLSKEQPGANYATKRKGYDTLSIGRAGGKEVAVEHSQVGKPHNLHVQGERMMHLRELYKKNRYNP